MLLSIIASSFSLVWTLRIMLFDLAIRVKSSAFSTWSVKASDDFFDDSMSQANLRLFPFWSFSSSLSAFLFMLCWSVTFSAFSCFLLVFVHLVSLSRPRCSDPYHNIHQSTNPSLDLEMTDIYWAGLSIPKITIWSCLPKLRPRNNWHLLGMFVNPWDYFDHVYQRQEDYNSELSRTLLHEPFLPFFDYVWCTIMCFYVGAFAIDY